MRSIEFVSLFGWNGDGRCRDGDGDGDGEGDDDGMNCGENVTLFDVPIPL